MTTWKNQNYLMKLNRPQKVFVANSSASSVKNKKLFEQGKALKKCFVNIFSE
jgi:hypothetical protein